MNLETYREIIKDYPNMIGTYSSILQSFMGSWYFN